MTIQELSNQLASLQDSLEESDDSASAVSLAKLDNLRLNLQKELLVAGFEPLKGLDGVSLPDSGELEKLIPQAQAAIEAGESQAELVGKIVTTATTLLRTAGLSV